MQGPSSGGLGPAWTRGEIERPQGERDMGSWTASFYTPEQQQRLGVDEQGVAIQPATTSTHRMTLKQRARVVLLGVKLFRGALDQREVDAAADDEDGWARYEEEVVGGGGAAGGGEGVRPVPHRGDGAERDAARKKAAKKKARARKKEKKKHKKHRRAAGGVAASGGAGGGLEPLRHKARGPVGGLLRDERLMGRAVDLRQPKQGHGWIGGCALVLCMAAEGHKSRERISRTWPVLLPSWPPPSAHARAPSQAPPPPGRASPLHPSSGSSFLGWTASASASASGFRSCVGCLI